MTSLAARFVDFPQAYLVFLPLVFASAAVSGRIVRRRYPGPMVAVYAGFCLVASGVAFATYAWLSVFDRIPPLVLAFLVVADFIVGPVGVLAGGVWGASGAAEIRSAADAP